MFGNKTSNFHISYQLDQFSKDSEGYIGKLRANFMKTKYSIYDNGEKSLQSEDNSRKELGVIVHRSIRNNPTNAKDFDFIFPEELTRSLGSDEDHKSEFNHDWEELNNNFNELFIFDSTLPYFDKQKKQYVTDYVE